MQRRPASDYDLEKVFARQFLAGAVRLEDCPYYVSYVSTVDAEVALLRRLVGEPQRVLFVGGGPLPLSAILFARRLPGAKIDVMDIDSEALYFGHEAAEKAGVRIDMVEGDIVHPSNLRGYDAVVLALEAPLSRHDKRLALRRLTDAITPGTVVLVRGACDPDDPAYVCARDLLPRNIDILGVVPVFDGLSETIAVRARPKTHIFGEGAAPRHRQGL